MPRRAPKPATGTEPRPAPRAEPQRPDKGAAVVTAYLHRRRYEDAFKLLAVATEPTGGLELGFDHRVLACYTVHRDHPDQPWTWYCARCMGAIDGDAETGWHHRAA